MSLGDIPLLAMLKDKMAYGVQRQRVISQNVANSDTPGYAPSDLKPFTFRQALGGVGRLAPVEEARTSAMHLEGRASAGDGAWKVEVKPDSEAKLDGNQVVLEEQMMKMTQARLDYDTAVSLYQKSLSMIRTATRRPGG